MSRINLGARGETIARNFLEAKGYQFLDANFRCHYGEIDLIFKDGGTVVFVEVKTRKYLAQGLPEEAVTPRKLSHISRVGQFYLIAQNLLDKPARIDVVAIEMITNPPTIRHLQNVSQ